MLIRHKKYKFLSGARLRPTFLIALIFCIFIFTSQSCMSYQRTNQQLQMKLIQGRYQDAENLLAGNKRIKKQRNRLLYLFNRGYLAMMLGKHNESIKYFMEADNIIKEERNGFLNEAFALLVNPSVKTYHAEDFEEVMVHYFQMMNFLTLGNSESALVEVRRMNLVLNQMNDKWGQKNKYKDDAFAHLMMGLIYESTRDYNNAFIAYRNAYNTYESDYKENFGISAPLQLKKDLIRTAKLTGFNNEVSYYEELFGLKYEPNESNRELILLWNNGLSPIKDQWSVDFTVVRQSSDMVYFVNNQFGFSFPFPIGHLSEDNKRNLFGLQIIRIAFPRYLSRPAVFQNASLMFNGSKLFFEQAQNIEGIAHKSLSDRFAREMGNALLRFALKKSAELALRKESKEAGMILGLANAITEQADIRNWQSLPAQISYLRIPLQEGRNKLVLNLKDAHQVISRTDTIVVNARPGLQFKQVFHLQSLPPGVMHW